MAHGDPPIGGFVAEVEVGVAASCWLDSVVALVVLLSPESFSFSFSPCRKERAKSSVISRPKVVKSSSNTSFTVLGRLQSKLTQVKSKPKLLMKHRVVKKIENSKRDGESNRGDFQIFVFLMLVKLSYMFREAGTLIRVDGEMRQLAAYFDNPGNIVVFLGERGKQDYPTKEITSQNRLENPQTQLTYCIRYRIEPWPDWRKVSAFITTLNPAHSLP